MKTPYVLAMAGIALAVFQIDQGIKQGEELRVLEREDAARKHSRKKGRE